MSHKFTVTATSKYAHLLREDGSKVAFCGQTARRWHLVSSLSPIQLCPKCQQITDGELPVTWSPKV